MGPEQSVLMLQSEKFVECFNQRDSKSLHKMFSVEMKQAIPLTELDEVLSQFSRQYGVITEKEFCIDTRIRMEFSKVELIKNKFSRKGS